MPVSIVPIKGENLEKFTSCYPDDVRGDRAKFGTGGCVLTTRFEKYVQTIKDFQVREDDVWIITPPKCGTTWTQEMVWLLLHDLDFETAKEEHLLQRSPFLELTCLVPGKTKEDFMKGLDTIKIANELTSPRCIKSHLVKDLLPDELWSEKAKIVYVAREPKDVAVSYYHHEKLLFGFRGEMNFFFECFYKDMVGYAPIWEHMLDFWKMKDEPNVLFNTFEEMKKDLPSVIRRTAKFLGKTVTDEQVVALAEHLDFKQMKKNRSVNAENLVNQLRGDRELTDDQAFIRKGAVGDGRREMSAEMAARFDARTLQVFNEAVGGSPWET